MAAPSAPTPGRREASLLAQSTVPGKPSANGRQPVPATLPPPLPPALPAEPIDAPTAEPDNPTFELSVIALQPSAPLPPLAPAPAASSTEAVASPVLAQRVPTPPPQARPPGSPPRLQPPARPASRPSIERPALGKLTPAPAPSAPAREDATFQMDQAELQRRLADQPPVLPADADSTRAVAAVGEELDDTTKPQTSRQEQWAARTQPSGPAADDRPDDEQPASRTLLIATAAVWVGAVTLAVYATLITVRG